MGLERVPAGRDVPHEVNVIIEIPMNAEPVKYEVDKESGAIFVDRVLTTPMRYPCNYGYIPRTLSGDGDPADVLVVMPLPLIPGSVIRVRPIGMLAMQDEAGEDTKLIAVPTVKAYSAYAHFQALDDVPERFVKLVVDEPDAVYAALREGGHAVLRWDLRWTEATTGERDCGPAWSRHVLQLLCHQDLTPSQIDRTAAFLRDLIETGR